MCFGNSWEMMSFYIRVTTSYDYRAPISENGDITDTYKAIRTFIQNLTDWNYPPQDIPANNPMANYGTVQLQRVGTGLISTLNQILEACHSSNYPMSFEDINHGYGFVLYTTTLGASGKTLSTPNIRDFGYVFLNNVYQGMLNRDASKSVSLNNANSGDVLRILVENGGRQAYSIIEDYKSLFNATLDGNILQNWIQCGVNLTESSVNSLTGQFLRREFEEEGAQLATSQPGVFVGQFSASVLQDTFFDSTGLGKGQLFINGFNLGRYWPGAGPQASMSSLFLSQTLF
uniref:Glycoside hydrolase 35 catalytic domain-containing protein n=1 Tax=Acrobeloides nanus TaxID=290746 RepID=A0A914EGP6_9BILA